MELLAHASAPSSRKDDDRFKRQALAYSTFKPANVISINRNDNPIEAEASRIIVKTPARQVYFDPDVFVDNTQLAYTALDSQLLTSSQGEDFDDGDEYSYGSEGIQDYELLSESLNPVHGGAARGDLSGLPPNESSQIDGSLRRNTGSPEQPRSSNSASTRSHGQGNYIESPYMPLRVGDTTFGGPPTTAELLATPSVRPRLGVKVPAQRTLPQESLSSPGDDIPSQLPSTYSLSDISSDNSAGPFQSSPWGSLPRGSAPAGTLPDRPRWDEHSPSKESGTSRADQSSAVKGAPSSSLNQYDVTLPQIDTQSSRIHRANSYAPMQASTGRYAVSSVSLDRAVVSPSKKMRTRVQDVSSSMPEPALSRPRATGTNAQRVQQTLEAVYSSPNTKLDFLAIVGIPPTNEPIMSSLASEPRPADVLEDSRIVEKTSSPAADQSHNGLGKVTQVPVDSSPAVASSAVSRNSLQLLGRAQSEAISTKSTPVIPRLSRAGPNLLNRAQSEIVTGTATPVSGLKLQTHSTPGSRVPETVIAAKKRKYAAISTPKTKPSTQELETLRSLSMQIRPPPPPTSIKGFKSHVTPYLNERYNSYQTEGLMGRYKSTSPTRSLQQSERGYWLVDTSSWSLEVQIKFWRFLAHEISKGFLGWGVWCVRELDEKTDESTQDILTQQELGTVKVFCWGEVVSHIWLLIYVASASKLRFIGSKWIDADGEVVIRI